MNLELFNKMVSVISTQDEALKGKQDDLLDEVKDFVS